MQHEDGKRERRPGEIGGGAPQLELGVFGGPNGVDVQRRTSRLLASATAALGLTAGRAAANQEPVPSPTPRTEIDLAALLRDLPKCGCEGSEECAQLPPLATRSTKGRLLVRVGSETKPIAGVEIQLVHLKGSIAQLTFAITDDQGRFAFKHVRRGRYHLHVCRRGFVTLERDLAVADDLPDTPIDLVTQEIQVP